MSERSYSIIELIKYLIGFFFGRRKKKAEQSKKESDKLKADIQEEFDDIDKQKESAKKKDLEKRLNNMFD